VLFKEKEDSEMDYEIITVNEYYGNNFSYKRQAILYEDGTLEYLPEPEPPEEQEENYDV
jgi:hypothetical protein